MATQAQVVTPATRFAKWSLAVLIAINVLNFYDRHVAGALVEPVRKEFGLSDTQIGWINTAFTMLYGVVGLPLGLLADKVNRKKLLAVGVTVWAALTASAAWARSYGFLVFSRLGLGVGEAACAPISTSWIGDLYPPQRRAKPLLGIAEILHEHDDPRRHHAASFRNRGRICSAYSLRNRDWSSPGWWNTRCVKPSSR